MNRHSRDISVIRHISDYCRDIREALEQYGNDREVFMTDKVFRNGLAMCVLQIGELVGHLSDEFRAGHPEIPWTQVKRMRNILAHSYAQLDYPTTWDILTDDIPQLAAFCAKTLDAEAANADAPQD